MLAPFPPILVGFFSIVTQFLAVVA